MTIAGPGYAAWEGHVVVCGLHAEGLRIVEQLRAAGVSVVLVDDSPDPRLVRDVERLEVPRVTGDSRDPETLATAGLPGATALVCVESDDVHTLATALLARRLRSDLRVVVQLSNPAVGRALTEVGVSVLDVASLSAPSVVEACLQSDVHPLRLGPLGFAVARTTCTADGTLRALFGDLTPVAVLPAGVAGVVVAPSRDLVVQAGDTTYLAGTREDLLAVGAGRPAARPRPQYVSSRAYHEQPVRPDALWRSVLGVLDRPLRRVLASLLGLVVVSTTILLVGYREPNGTRMSVLDAVYFTIETIGTVGYGDFYFRDQHGWLRAWAILLMIVGATLATVLFAFLTNVLVSRRLEESLGRRRITGLDGHVIVVGLGSVGLAVVEQLVEQGVPAVVVDRDEANPLLAQVRRRRVPVVRGDATLPETQRALQVDRARAVAVVTSDDLVNIESALAFRDLLGERWRRVPVVLRLFDGALADTVGSSFDFRNVRSTAALAAPWFVGAALGLEVLNTFYVGDQPMLVARLDVGPGVLDGVQMLDLGARIRVLMIQRPDGSTEHPVRRDSSLAAGDRAYLAGPYEELLAVLRGGGPVSTATSS